MARQIRVEYENAWYHITCRGNERRQIFGDDFDRKKLLEYLSDSQKLYEVELHAYVLMSNHFHLIIKTRQANLQKFMQRFNTSYTMYYNRKYRRSGHLYQGRYKAILVEADEYLLELSRYIHLNPVKIKKYRKLSIPEQGKTLQEYKWSSFCGYVQLRCREDNVSYKTVLGILYGRDDRKGRNQYKKFMIDGLAKESSNKLWEEVRGQAILGSEGFIDWVYDNYLIDRREDKKEQRGIEEIKLKDLSLEKIAEKVARQYETATEELFKKRSRQSESRSILIELCKRYMTKKMSLSAIGEELGGISISAISQNSKRLNKKLQENRRLMKRFIAVEKEIIRG